jgi:Oxidoreductase-like protein, N-terminal
MDETNERLPSQSGIAALNAEPPGGDPEPQAPIEPPLEACCTSGCVPCIFDDYAEQLHEYRAALMAWKARQAAKIKPPLE